MTAQTRKALTSRADLYLAIGASYQAVGYSRFCMVSIYGTHYTVHCCVWHKIGAYIGTTMLHRRTAAGGGRGGQ